MRNDMACLLCKTNRVLLEGGLIFSEQRQKCKEEIVRSRMDSSY